MAVRSHSNHLSNHLADSSHQIVSISSANFSVRELYLLVITFFLVSLSCGWSRRSHVDDRYTWGRDPCVGVCVGRLHVIPWENKIKKGTCNLLRHFWPGTDKRPWAAQHNISSRFDFDTRNAQDILYSSYSIFFLEWIQDSRYFDDFKPSSRLLWCNNPPELAVMKREKKEKLMRESDQMPMKVPKRTRSPCKSCFRGRPASCVSIY